MSILSNLTIIKYLNQSHLQTGKRYFLSIFLCISLTLVFGSGCKYVEPGPPPAPQEIILEPYPDAPKPDVGMLTVYTFNNNRNFTPFGGCYVQLFDSYEAYLAQVNDPKRRLYLQSIKTDQNGMARFGELLQGNYTLWVTYSNGSSEFSNTYTAQVIGAKTLVRNIILK